MTKTGMDDLISRWDLIEELEKINIYDPICILRDTKIAVRKAPAVKVKPVVNGNWVYYSTTMQECSNCKRHTERHKFKYCPHCGASMGEKLHYAID